MRKGSAFVAGQFALFLLIALAPRMRRSDWPLDVRVPGLVLLAVGLILCIWGVRTLGPAMTAMPEPREDAPIATGGPYRFVRHPVYTGVLGIALGVSLARETAAGLVLTAVLAVLFDVKSRYEERLLAGDATYAGYRAATRFRFLPFLY